MAWLTVLCLVVLLVSPVKGTCESYTPRFPHISYDRVAIGNVKLFASKDDVRAAYGEPDEVIDYRQYQKYNRYTPDEVWIYKKTFNIYFFNDKVCQITSEGRNGLVTPDKIQVGDPEAKVVAAYGRKGLWNNQYIYESDHHCTMGFYMRKGNVKMIIIKCDLQKQNNNK